MLCPLDEGCESDSQGMGDPVEMDDIGYALPRLDAEVCRRRNLRPLVHLFLRHTGGYAFGTDLGSDGG